MPAPSIQVEGLRELNSRLRKVRDTGLDGELKRIHKGLADDVVSLALPNVPKRSGALMRSVRASGTKASAIGRAGRKSVPYAATIHWGRRKRGRVQGRPFLQDAAKRVERDVVDDYQRAIKRLLDKAI